MNHWMITQGRIIKTGIQNFFRNATLAVAAIAVMVITLTIVLFSIVANATFANTVSQITDKIDISVYLKDEVTPAQREALLKDLQSVPNVKSIRYVSKDEALERYKEDNKDNTQLLAAISETENPLPASILIKPADPNKIADIQQALDRPDIKKLTEHTDTQEDRKQALNKITSATRFFQNAGVVGVVIFATVSMLIIFNTIRMAIFNRRDELQIMRLLGASSWYIRGPFVMETLLYGVVSALLSLAICHFLFVLASSALGASSLGLLDIQYASNYFSDHFGLFLITQTASGILIGAVSSVIATRRYLKFKTSK